MRYASILAISTVLMLLGCASRKPSSADEYFAVASEHLSNGAYSMAVEQFRELLDQYPFSEHSEEAELKIAQALYMDGSCPEAIAAFTDFQRRHPTSPHLPLVGFLIGQCHEQRMRPPDRDQSASRSAHAYYLALTQQYPDSPFADLARQQLLHCRESLAQHELVVASYYRRHGNLKAMEFRLLDLVNNFNDTDIAANALYQLGDFYREQEERDRASLAFAAVIRHHPDNLIARRAERALADLGEPDDLPRGDPLVVLRAQAGRSRSVALAQPTETDETALQKRRVAPGASIGGLPGDSGPFGGGGFGGY